MLQVARLAPTLLGESKDLVAAFLRGMHNGEGGFKDRAGDSDLYYTVFGLEGLLALDEPLPATISDYLRQFGDGSSLDFVHLTCLARAWATWSRSGPPPEIRDAIARRLQQHRSADGGFAVLRSADVGSAYACFLAVGALEDLGTEIEPHGVRDCLHGLRSTDGAYANVRGATEGSTPATAAAAMVLHQLGYQVDPDVADWLARRCHPEGGFFAAPRAPLPDLLSTATSLHALSALQWDFGQLREPCLDFVDSLWTNAGGFYGNWTDQTLDCEYTYYGLLALGHLSL
jgi:prenyltransferase beta subunit